GPREAEEGERRAEGGAEGGGRRQDAFGDGGHHAGLLPHRPGHVPADPGPGRAAAGPGRERVRGRRRRGRDRGRGKRFMSENDRTGDRPAGRPKVKVTDRRRVREEGAAAATPSEAPGSGDRRSTPEAELAAARKEAAEYREH